MIQVQLRRKNWRSARGHPASSVTVPVTASHDEHLRILVVADD